MDSKVGKPFQNPQLAEFMVTSLCRDNKTKYLLHAYVIMPNHLHLILKQLSDHTLARIMHTLKGSSAYAINKMLNRTGRFWQTENFDHLIRDDASLHEKWDYIKENPVKARLVDKAEDYLFSSFHIPGGCAG